MYAMSKKKAKIFKYKKKVPKKTKEYVKKALKRFVEPKHQAITITYGNTANAWTSNQFRELTLCSPRLGNESHERVGDEIKITGFDLTLGFQQVFDDSSDIWYGFRRPTDTFRIFVIVHRQCNKAILDLDEVLKTDTANYSNIVAPRNDEYKNTMHILYDKVITLKNDNTEYPELSYGGYASLRRVIRINKKFKRPITQRFDGDTGTYQDIVKNRLLFGIIWYGAQTNASLKPYIMELTSNVHYYDA